MASNNCMSAGSMNEGCGCVGYAYVPIQELNEVFGVDRAVRAGTVFPELELGINEYGKICRQWGDADDE